MTKNAETVASSLTTQAFETIYAMTIPGELKRNADDEHTAILSHILNGDEDNAASELIAHYTKTGAFLSERLS